jgi:predicted 3-demethylubiquinone-9 3-methyltransferase (glyoxalase superfamily)
MDMIADSDTVKSQRAFEALLHMKRLDIKTLQRAFNG